MATVDRDEGPVRTAQKPESHDNPASAREAEVTLNIAGPGVAASIVRLTSAISLRLEEDLKANAAASSKTDVSAAFKQQYDYIAAQILRADALIHSRMSWTLQLDGFLLAALALTRIAPTGEGRSVEIMGPWLAGFLLGALPLAGLAITVAGWLGLRGAIRQLKHLGSEYAQEVKRFASESGWPNPFGDLRAAWYVTGPAQLSLATLCFLWSWLVAHRVWPEAVETYSNAFLRVLRDWSA